MIRFMKKNGLQTDFTSQMSVYIFYGQVVFIIIIYTFYYYQG